MMNEQLGIGLRLFIGVAELLAAAGLILPAVTRILPFLTALAAAGLMIVMASATILHIFRGESGSAVSAAILFVLVTIVAYTGWKCNPSQPESAPKHFPRKSISRSVSVS